MHTQEAVVVATSPFAAASVGAESDEADVSYRPGGPAASPFAGLTTEDEAASDRARWGMLVEALADEEFEQTVDGLVAEVAGRHLRTLGSRSSFSPDATGPAVSEVAEWLDEVGRSTEARLAELEERYVDRPADGLTLESLQEATNVGAESFDPVGAASEQLFGGLLNKAVSAAKGLAGAGLKAIGGLLPLGKIFGVLRKLVRPLLQRVLAKAINRLPAGLRGPATTLATRFLTGEVSEEADLAGEFDATLAEVLLAPTDAGADQLLAEDAATAGQSLAQDDPLTRLDAARDRLARELSDADPGRPPTEQLEQFIPAVMAALPLVRTGVKIVGRERIKRFLAQALATLIQGYVGPTAARALAPHIADTGLGLLRLEAETVEGQGAEALVDTVEETLTEIARLPEEALDDPLRLELELTEAFSGAAARLLPRAVLREDLETFETPGHQSGEAWVLMPRRTPGCRRYRRFGRVFDVSIDRPAARAIVLGEDTLEDRLLEAGVDRWPVGGEAHVYEATVGTQLGHLAAFEGGVDPVDAREFEQLSPATAGLLLGRPGLGSRVAPGGALLVPGRRLFRLVVPGRNVRRGPRAIVLRIDTSAATPILRMHVRLGERAAHLLSGHLARQAMPEALGVVRSRLGPVVRQSLAGRLARHLARATGSPPPAQRGQQLSAQVVEAALAAVSQQLGSRAAELAAAAKDPQPGLTLTFAFRFAEKQALTSGTPDPPELTVRPGLRRD